MITDLRGTRFLFSSSKVGKIKLVKLVETLLFVALFKDLADFIYYFAALSKALADLTS